MALVQKYLSKKRGRFYCTFNDFAKAFDSICHDKLWDCLQRNGIKGNFLNVLKSMYGNLKYCVRIGNRLTPLFDCTVATRQSRVGSPKLFNIFIDYLIKLLKDKSSHGIFV